MDLNFDLYMNGVVEQARNEIESAGYEQLTTSDEVDKVFKQDGTTLVMINSVCGCAGGIARPAASHALHYDKLPNRLVTVFAGQDKEATQTMRDYIQQVPSSPSYALFKGQHLVHFIPREHIEGRDINDIAMDLKDAFDDNCQ